MLPECVYTKEYNLAQVPPSQDRCRRYVPLGSFATPQGVAVTASWISRPGSRKGNSAPLAPAYSRSCAHPFPAEA
jgi:hypothetical protein